MQQNTLAIQKVFDTLHEAESPIGSSKSVKNNDLPMLVRVHQQEAAFCFDTTELTKELGMDTNNLINTICNTSDMKGLFIMFERNSVLIPAIAPYVNEVEHKHKHMISIPQGFYVFLFSKEKSDHILEIERSKFIADPDNYV